jgi:hypothetical protein
MRVRMLLLCPLVGLATILASCGHPVLHVSLPTSTQTPKPTKTVQRLSQPDPGPVAGPVDPDRRVGAIFLDGSAQHVCTGSVLHSAAGNLVLTAAHCLAGAAQITFVPGLSGDAVPPDFWTADNVYLDPRWIASKDPHADYAIARVNSDTVVGYPSGVGGSPIGCQGSTAVTDGGFPSLVCQGLVGGTSGAPWVNGTTVVGLIGGLERGGCAENMSYSAPFDDHIVALLARAEAGGPGDPVPVDVDDTC